MRKAIVIGLTGQSGAGKSTVALQLKKYGYAVIDADAIARLVMEKGSPILPKIRETFGSDVFNPDSSVNRAALARKAFSSPENTKKLNEITHPEITRLVLKKVKGAFFDGYEGVIIDAPQLFESKLSYDCKFIISVVAPENVRLKRIMERDELTEEDALRRIRAQHTEEFFREHSNVVIENNGDEERLRGQVRLIARVIEEQISGEETADNMEG